MTMEDHAHCSMLCTGNIPVFAKDIHDHNIAKAVVV